MIYRSITMAIAALFLAAVAHSQPAPWYKWRSKVNGQLVCSQTSPGEGWERDSGPYTDSRCETPVKK